MFTNLKCYQTFQTIIAISDCLAVRPLPLPLYYITNCLDVLWPSKRSLLWLCRNDSLLWHVFGNFAIKFTFKTRWYSVSFLISWKTNRERKINYHAPEVCTRLIVKNSKRKKKQTTTFLTAVSSPCFSVRFVLDSSKTNKNVLCQKHCWFLTQPHKQDKAATCGHVKINLL